MLVIHHLGVSQSERIVWLFEELGLEYKLVKHTRAPNLSPESLKSLPGNNTGKSPFFQDNDAGITLSESGAICEYIINKYGNGRLTLPPNDKNYHEYLHFFHFANGTLQSNMVCSMFINAAGVSEDNMLRKYADQRLSTPLQILDGRLKDNKWLAGDEFTVADIMMVYCLTTQRYFGPLVSWAPYENVLRYLKDIAARPAYQRAMDKGDPEMKILNEADPPKVDMMHAGGVESDHWKK